MAHLYSQSWKRGDLSQYVGQMAGIKSLDFFLLRGCPSCVYRFHLIVGFTSFAGD